MDKVIESAAELVGAVYGRTRARVTAARARLGRPLTLTEKILFGPPRTRGDGRTWTPAGPTSSSSPKRIFSVSVRGRPSRALAAVTRARVRRRLPRRIPSALDQFHSSPPRGDRTTRVPLRAFPPPAKYLSGGGGRTAEGQREPAGTQRGTAPGRIPMLPSRPLCPSAPLSCAPVFILPPQYLFRSVPQPRGRPDAGGDPAGEQGRERTVRRTLKPEWRWSCAVEPSSPPSCAARQADGVPSAPRCARSRVHNGFPPTAAGKLVRFEAGSLRTSKTSR